MKAARSVVRSAAANEAQARRLDKIKPYEPPRPVMTLLAPWGEYEHTIDGVVATASAAFRKRAHRWFTEVCT